MGEIALRLEREFQELVSIDGIDPEAAELIARNVAAMPNETDRERESQLLAWVVTLRSLRDLELAIPSPSTPTPTQASS